MIEQIIGLVLDLFKWLVEKIIKINLVVFYFLSTEEKQIIKNGREGIYRFTTDQTGPFVRSGKVDFYFKNDPQKTTKYNEALDSLIKKKLVFYQRGILFKLTNKGYSIYKFC